MKKVTVQYLFGGVINEMDNEEGILFTNGKVFVAGGNEIGLYNAIGTENKDVVTVDLDNDTEEFMREDPTVLIELMAAV
ncbi:hypothetical protein H9655_21145 [Cytobacillus sp. Sa5YUA1]|uniref:Uncharacterized protein n=1 Tax=Cytobacillus stercorigallinarum TaxID=2762240 RepID=A0ABR8QVP4_9BACI|nr:hypothetical protein [Cytobacillus stercorigallinarum]MBD7939553.1 hypothetical protein [Cytobacillus stercorigallinarum]